jgi:hypothetical protein
LFCCIDAERGEKVVLGSEDNIEQLVSGMITLGILLLLSNP